tara:strand:- start:852 stop:959 length:108 start_codon:yes stop_codon:yes gene_type:complete
MLSSLMPTDGTLAADAAAAVALSAAADAELLAFVA